MSVDDGYVDVATRITQFRAKHPEGSLHPFDDSKPYEIINVEGKTFVVVVAAAYRSPDDTMPGVGMAWEPFPGQSPYTEDSELQNCFASETEVLTPEGWVRLDRLESGVPVASAAADGTWQFDRPLNYISRTTSSLVTIEDNLTRQRVTPDHRVLVGNQFYTAGSLLKNTLALSEHKKSRMGVGQTRSADQQGRFVKEIKPIRIEGQIPQAGLLTGRIGSLNDDSENYARLLQWVIADGCYPKGLNCEPILFGFTKERKIVRLAQLLDDLGVTYWRGQSGKGRTDFRIGAKDPIGKDIRADIPDKTIDDVIALKFSHPQAMAFIEEAQYTDGYVPVRGGIEIRVTDRGYIEAMCLLGAAHGFDATSLAFDLEPGPYPNAKPIHRVRLKRNTRRMPRRITIENFDVPVPVYCVTMPAGTVVTRNNAKITVSGNCQTGAWGRAIVAALAADTTKSIASSEDVRNRVAADKKDKPAAAKKPPVKRAPPSVAAKADAGFEGSGPPVSEVEPPPLEVKSAIHAIPTVDDDEDEAAEAEALMAELTNGSEPVVAERVPCADCNGEIESDDQVDLSALRFRRPLCRSCFIAAKRPASVN